MKKVITALLLLIQFCTAQTHNLLFEAGYSFMLPYPKESYNFTALFSAENSRSKIVPAVGIHYLSFRYSEDQALTYYIINSMKVKKIRTYVQSVSLPFFLRMNNLKQRKINISPFVGFSLVLQTRTLQKLYLLEGGSEKLLGSYASAKIFPLLGIYFSKKLSERINIHLVPYASLQLKSYEMFLYPKFKPPKTVNLSYLGLRFSMDYSLLKNFPKK